MSPTNWHAACLVGYPSRPQPERHSQTALAIAKADTAPAIAMRPQAMATSLPQPTAGTGRLPAGTAIAKAATAIAIAMAAYQQRAYDGLSRSRQKSISCVMNRSRTVSYRDFL